jgi:hypothetical protein
VVKKIENKIIAKLLSSVSGFYSPGTISKQRKLKDEDIYLERNATHYCSVLENLRY